jgi:hypothetical protein
MGSNVRSKDMLREVDAKEQFQTTEVNRSYHIGVRGIKSERAASI